MEYEGLPVRHRGTYVGFNLQRLEAVEAPHWKLEQNKADNSQIACFAALETYIESRLDGLQYHHGAAKALVCLAILDDIIGQLDAFVAVAALIPTAREFVQRALLEQKKPALARLHIPVLSPVGSPRPSPRAVAPIPRTPKRFIELPKHEIRVLEVAAYLRSVLSQLAGAKQTTEATPNNTQLLRRTKVQLRQKQYFPGLFLGGLMPRQGPRGDAGGNFRDSNIHQVLVSSVLCIHEVIRGIAVHSVDLSMCARHLLGHVLVAIEQYLAEVADHRRVHRSRIKALRQRRQELRGHLTKLNSQAALAAKESIELATVLSGIETEHAVLQRECDWHATARDLFTFTLEKIQVASRSPPMAFVNSDGSMRALTAGSGLLRMADIEAVKELAHLLGLSRSYVHLFLKEENEVVLSPHPPQGRRQSIKARATRKSIPERIENLKQHLLNVKAKDSGPLDLPPPEEPVDVMHRVTHAELLVLSTIHDSLRAVEVFTADVNRREHLLQCEVATQTVGAHHVDAIEPSVALATQLLHELVRRKLPALFQRQLELVPDDASFVVMGREELFRIVAHVLGQYDEMLHHADYNMVPPGSYRAMALADFVAIYFYMHPLKKAPDDPVAAQIACARFLLSLHGETSGLHVMDLLILFASLIGLGTTSLELPPRALDSLLSARRTLLVTTVVKGHADVGGSDVVWLFAKDKDTHAGHTLLETVVRALQDSTHLTGVRDKQAQVASDKAIVVSLFVEAEGVSEVQRTPVINIETGLVCIMQAWIEEHHFTFRVLSNIIRACLTAPDGTMTFDEFAATMGYMDPAFTPTRLGSLYLQAATKTEAGGAANLLGEATASHLVRALYESDLFTECTKHWLYVPAMQLSNQKAWDSGGDGLRAMWAYVRDRLLDKLAEFQTDQTNAAPVHTCLERFRKFEQLLTEVEKAGSFDANVVEVGWYAYHFLQQDVAWTAHMILKQHKPKKYQGGPQRWDSTKRLANLYDYVSAKDRRQSVHSADGS
ncbi:hypothetical protein ACHHYP_10989 [Achlya hypogyna]|uniref:Uncharacterized protein n=1 Tax=Achlya hypogyna TaxID=1202772 RepID=A0A1V9YK29_ACHHY|nr:hypothetical protein ACHHYP_10989 [Achlya hypogyna]